MRDSTYGSITNWMSTLFSRPAFKFTEPKFQTPVCTLPPLERVGVEGGVGEIHLHLEMPGIDGVGRFRLVRPVRAHLTHRFARDGMEKIVTALVRRRFIREFHLLRRALRAGGESAHRDG